jgi:putative ABC transport system permease protein
MAGIYAVMSFTAARRTREIGIRVALGSSRSRVVLSVFRRPLGQVALGLGSGIALLTVLLARQIGSLDGREWLRLSGLLLGYAVVTSLVCVAACASPTACALRVEPQEALRVDG